MVVSYNANLYFHWDFVNIQYAKMNSSNENQYWKNYYEFTFDIFEFHRFIAQIDALTTLSSASKFD